MRYYRTGLKIPQSGIYRVTHSRHRLPHEVNLLQGETFPRCAKCEDKVQFALIGTAEDQEAGKVAEVIYELPEARGRSAFAGRGSILSPIARTRMADIISEVLPHLRAFFNDHCLVLFPVSGSHELRIYYGEYVGEVSSSGSEYLYAVRSITSAAYLARGTAGNREEAIRKLHAIMSHLRRPAIAA
jgi:hypothetical protein